MTQNLALGSGSGAITLHAYDSDVSSDWVLPVAQTSGSDSWGDSYNINNEKHLYATGNTTYGNYYNWFTATAGTGTSDMRSTSTTDLTNAESSICPRGWRLPDGGQAPTKSFYALDIASGGDGELHYDADIVEKYLSAPYSFVYSGYYDVASGVLYQGVVTQVLTRSAGTLAADGIVYAFNINKTNNAVGFQGMTPVGFGQSVRCISK